MRPCCILSWIDDSLPLITSNFCKNIYEKPPLKKNIVSQMISSVQVPVFTPGSLVQDLRVTQFALFSSSAKALTLTEAGTQVLLSVIQKKKYDYPQCGTNSLKKNLKRISKLIVTYIFQKIMTNHQKAILLRNHTLKGKNRESTRWDRRTFYTKVLSFMNVGTTSLILI